MAHTVQAKKRIRQDIERNAANRTQRSTLRTTIKKLEHAVNTGAKDVIPAAFNTAMAELHKAGRKGLISRGSANRKVSRLAALVKRGQAPSTAK